MSLYPSGTAGPLPESQWLDRECYYEKEASLWLISLQLDWEIAGM